jgi:hypothetical protein
MQPYKVLIALTCLVLLAGCSDRKKVTVYPQDGQPIDCYIINCLDAQGGLSLYSDPDCKNEVGYVKGNFRVDYTTTQTLEQVKQ